MKRSVLSAAAGRGAFLHESKRKRASPAPSDGSPLVGSAAPPRWCDGSLHLTSPFLLGETLKCGQIFSWRCIGRCRGDELWTGVIGGRAYVLLQTHVDEASSLLHYKCMGRGAFPRARHRVDQGKDIDVERADDAQLLTHFFRLEWCSESLWRRWTQRDSGDCHPLRKHFIATAHRYKGIHIVRQDPVECLMGFICSQNNNIPRITHMVSRLRELYGDPIPLTTREEVWRDICASCDEFAGDTDGSDKRRGDGESPLKRPETSSATPNHHGDGDDGSGGAFKTPRYFTFPDVDALARVEESALRSLGFGYRARYIPASAQDIRKKSASADGVGSEWLFRLRDPNVSKDQCSEQLCTLLGVGRKVADCVSLFGLDKLDAVPVDTHVWRIARRHVPALDNLGVKTLTPSVYRTIVETFYGVFGDTCGWAHSLLFASEIRRPAARKATKKATKKASKKIDGAQ